MRRFVSIAATLGLLGAAAGGVSIASAAQHGATDVETLRLIFFETG